MFGAPFIVPEMGYDICPPRFHIGNLSHGGGIHSTLHPVSRLL